MTKQMNCTLCLDFTGLIKEYHRPTDYRLNTKAVIDVSGTTEYTKANKPITRYIRYFIFNQLIVCEYFVMFSILHTIIQSRRPL